MHYVNRVLKQNRGFNGPFLFAYRYKQKTLLKQGYEIKSLLGASNKHKIGPLWQLYEIGHSLPRKVLC